MRNKINITPISNNIITTANVLKTDKLTIMNVQPTFVAVQQVLAVGPNVEFVKVGDWVHIDYDRFVYHKKTKSSVKVGIGGQDIVKAEFQPPFYAAPGDANVYFKITDREIEGVLSNPKKLDKDELEGMPITEYEKLKDEAQAEYLKQTKKFNKKMGNVKTKESKGPAIIAEGKVRS